MEQADGQYNSFEAWNRPTSVYNAPTGSWEDTLLRQAEIVVTMDRAQVSAVVRPPGLVPPLPQRHMGAPGIQSVLGGSGRSVNNGGTQFSGTPAGYSGSPQNGFGGAIG